jgi:hypothetical protein
MYIFSDKIEAAIQAYITDNKVTIEPCEAPYVIVKGNKHTTKQKLSKVLIGKSEKEVKSLVEMYKEINSDLSEYVVSRSTEYVEVYQHPLYAIDSTSKSCMTYSSSVRVYGYDERINLFLVYKNDNLVLRTIVREDLKQYVRLYIDHNHIKSHVANAIIAKNGYVKGNIEGIKLQYIEEDNGVVCPYLDDNMQVDIVVDNYLEISKYGEHDTSTSGIIALGEECSCCGGTIQVEHIYYIEDTQICSECINQHYVYYNDEYYHIGTCILNESTNEYIPEHLASDANVVQTYCGDWYDLGDCCDIDYQWYHESLCVYLANEDSYGNSAVLKEDAIYNPNELDNLAKGYYTKEQIKDVLVTMNTTVNELQTDLFKENVNLKITQDEIDNLLIEITTIEELI